MLPALIVGSALLLTACSSDPASSSKDAPSVVASTNVYGSVAQLIGGSRVDVVSIIDGAGKDPHEYEASARDRLAVSQADVVVENGGGYDTFMESLLSSGSDGVVVLNAVDLSGLEKTSSPGADAEFNEHVWYDFAAVDAVGSALADALAAADPKGAADYRANYATFSSRLAAVGAKVDSLKATVAGTPVAITEPVPLYLFGALGLTNTTPPDFSEAVEEDTDVAPDVLAETLRTLDGSSARLLAYNPQTATAQTERVRQEAEKAGVPVVDFTETLPDGKDYVEWMDDNVGRVAQALGA
jgi:zinc/manganese transport system substrate-binding protein